MNSNGFAVILITTSQDEESQLIARVLLEQKIAACVNIIPQINSLFWWKQSIDQEKESMLIVKTRVKLIDEVVRLIKEVHSYEVPEIIALPIIGGNCDYLEWIDHEVIPEEAE
ncbi:MAG: divalent-cation tolerance protein CutA [Dehalococcoidales bacterium]|nr:divalent-cation tolerance protein CutA [Dehalococcoidales bacterium]MDX9986155.1 divalent-cation tolerance protein CutA [Dehalococcoidales bacterium]